jgi:hypothetical protein
MKFIDARSQRAGVYSLPQRSNNHITCAPPSTTQWTASPASPSPWGGALQPNKRGYYYYYYYYNLFYYLFVFYANPLPSSIPSPLNLHNRQVDDCIAGEEEVLIEGGQVEVEAEFIGHGNYCRQGRSKGGWIGGGDRSVVGFEGGGSGG